MHSYLSSVETQPQAAAENGHGPDIEVDEFLRAAGRGAAAETEAETVNIGLIPLLVPVARNVSISKARSKVIALARDWWCPIAKRWARAAS